MKQVGLNWLIQKKSVDTRWKYKAVRQIVQAYLTKEEKRTDKTPQYRSNERKEEKNERKKRKRKTTSCLRYLVCSTTRACFIVTTSAFAMSTPTMNHDSQTQQQQQQQQQQRTQINEIPHGHSNSASSPPTTLTRSDSTSTVILEEEETRPCRRNGSITNYPPSLLAEISAQLRLALKTSGLFNEGFYHRRKNLQKNTISCFFSLHNRHGIVGQVERIFLQWKWIRSTKITQ